MIETAGAPKTQYSINPKILAHPWKAPAKTDKSPESDLPSVLSGGSGEGGGGNRKQDGVEDDSDQRERDAIQSVEREQENDQNP